MAESTHIFSRDLVSCEICKSTMRFRAVIGSLTTRLHGSIQVLSRIKRQRDIRGLGISDAGRYAYDLSSKYSYTNTFYHQKPYFDITRPPDAKLRENDFIICSDVLEHIPYPVEAAVANLRSCLRPMGCLIVSVPFSQGKTVEHYPDLHDYRVLTEGGKCVLVNKRLDGSIQKFSDPVFHGGDGATLEMRVFGIDDFKRMLLQSGFTDVQIEVPGSSHWGFTSTRDMPLVLSAIAR